MEKMEERLSSLEQRMHSVESISSDISEILDTINKIGKRIKYWLPMVGAAAVSAGLVDGKLGAFIKALLT